MKKNAVFHFGIIDWNHDRCFCKLGSISNLHIGTLLQIHCYNTLLQCWYKYVVAMLVDHRHIAMLGSICSPGAPYWELVLCAQCASSRISGTLCCHVHPNTPQPISFCNSLSFETKNLNFIFWVGTEHTGLMDQPLHYGKVSIGGATFRISNF